MKTSIEFNTRTEEMREIITGIIEEFVDGDYIEQDDAEEAVSVIIQAFISAGNRAFIGESSESTARSNIFMASADLRTGEFELFRKIS